MIVCGVLLKGSEAILAVCAQPNVRDEIEFKQLPVAKIPLGDDRSSSSMKAFKEAVTAFAQENEINSFVIKSRAKKGRMAGGGISFKMEAIFQLIEGCSSEFISPNALASFIRKTDIRSPDKLFAYQADAFYAAASFLTGRK